MIMFLDKDCFSEFNVFSDPASINNTIFSTISPSLNSTLHMFIAYEQHPEQRHYNQSTLCDTISEGNGFTLQLAKNWSYLGNVHYSIPVNII